MDTIDINRISRDLFHMIFQIHKKAFNHEQFIKGMPIPPSNVKVIFFLTQRGCTSVSEIAKHLSISKPNMTPIIDNLINDGLVIRTNDPTDRRKFKIELTNEGHNFLRDQKNHCINEMSEKMSKLSDEEILKLSEAINTFVNIFSKL